ncbi:hypothetical protein IscW_ISCW005056 [Ixodes scapularis]|uniref:Spaetzle domain-containing protein n=1 Tax=Ixodes scapularis TaxID=6945 RepID=B7PE84_IXOSC|nr:hypothetical protein IscW_ISCW005056 [Ixodes scapularis]|eukprot:XP_002400352.1 hypothetical protein IscW_ISCW005056 [Ixodes scapularis]
MVLEVGWCQRSPARLVCSALCLVWCAQVGVTSCSLGPVWSAVSSSSYYIADVSPPPRPGRGFVPPTPPYCPETGRTICADVDDYPTDYIYHVLVASKSKHFNFSTLFVDERLGDSEPNRALLPDQPRTDSYLVDLVKRAPEVDPACLVRTMFVSPKAGLNDRSEWKYVVNVQERDSRAKQVIRVDVCR